MEVIQGKQKDKKVVIAQEIAFAKVLAGNNKTLRDRAVKKLRKWLTVRGSGKWEFTEEDFFRIWTGLFYCMWMSDKFLVQEELAESISKLIHCFKNNSDTALLFIKSFNERILMDWEGLDQYRIDKFNMLVRRFLRQTFQYCKEKNWDLQLLQKLMGIFYDVLKKDYSLGFIMHFINIYPEELAKVSGGKLSNEIVTILIEPFVKLLARTQEDRVQKETEELFNYLMRQTDTGIEFEARFNAWREQGFPGEGPHCMKAVLKSKGTDTFLENEDESFSEDDNEDDEFADSKPFDPRAGSVHVFLPQIPVDPVAFIKLFEKHMRAKQTTPKGKRLLRNLVQKYTTLKKGKFPRTIKKDPIIIKTKNKKQTIKNARELLKFTEELKNGPVQTKEFVEMSKELEDQSDSESEIEKENDLSTENGDEKEFEESVSPKKNKLKKNAVINDKKEKKVKKKKKIQENKIKKKSHQKENIGEEETPKMKKPKVKKKKKKCSVETTENNDANVDEKQKEMKKQTTAEDAEKMTPVSAKASAKRKILSNWQVQELDANSPEYYEIKTPKVIRIERKVDDSYDQEENDCLETTRVETLEEIHESPKQEISPIFWEKAKAKAIKSATKKGKIFKNPFAEINGGCKSPGMRRISFALEKNMAQENEEYLEEVKNSPRVPFDGSKKPVQSALKSGLTPSPVNPFYRFKKIKF